MQGPGGPEEDTTGGFDRGGWMVKHTDDEFGAIVDGWFSRTEQLLLGRTTYDIFSGYWPQVTDPANGIARSLNSAPKHVVSTTLSDPTWAHTSVINGTADEIVESIRALKAQAPSSEGGELQVHGSCGLIHWLHDAGLVDEYHVIVFPVVVGTGKKLFHDGAVPSDFTVVQAATSPTGLVSLVLSPTGDFRQGNHEVIDGRDTAVN